MADNASDLLTRFPLLETADLGVAQQVTADFWPQHTSEVLGPDQYELVMNRALLGQIAITFVRCTARVRVVPSEPSREACMVVPLTGSVEIETEAGTFRATPSHPLVRGPAWVRRFEASPSTCLLVDLPAAALPSLAHRGDQMRNPAAVASLSAAAGQMLVRQLLNFVRLINRNDRVQALQKFSHVDRQRLLTPATQRRERALITAITAAVEELEAGQAKTRSAENLSSIEALLADRALSGQSLNEIARQLGTTNRAIQRTCEKAGFTPQAFIRGVRLDRARALLLDPSSATTVADVAVAVCIPHLGRFSEYYRERFGELPSATLARSRTQHPELP